MKRRRRSIVPARGPIRLQIDVPPTAAQCGVRYNIHLSPSQAATVRKAARMLGMETMAFIQAFLDGDMPTARPRRNRKISLGGPLRVACDDPSIRARLNRAARYYGDESVETYLARLLAVDLWCDEVEIIVHPKTRRPVGDDAFWKEMERLLSVHVREFTADPLDHPGFLDFFPNRNPLHYEGPLEAYDDPRLKPPRIQLAEAA